MGIKKVWKKVIIFVAFIALIPLVIYFLIRFTPKPPKEEMEDARIALSEAASSNADTYSRNIYREAKDLYDSAMRKWQAENKRFLYFRNYDTVTYLAKQSEKKAFQAAKISRNNVSDLSITLKQKIDTLNKIVDRINKLFAAYPLSSEVRKNISKGEILLNESRVAYNKGEYIQTRRKLSESDRLLTSSYEIATTSLKEYFTRYPVWKKWADNTIRESRQNQTYSIIIDKYSRKCDVYYGGIKKFEYTVELGRNWVGDKRVKGDKATPEGMYRIIKKFGSNKTKYHKALLINYPNDADLDEFKQEIAKGTLPKSAKIGNLIEIHGDGGRGIDWTEGCVALTNNEIDELFKVAKEGTPVTIVGSLISLDKILD
ncbi:MAG: L,D-transpeptidase family protein [Bacteroidota bacterium]|nr:L,D-transpeptidase family protein [Bacteroidota bacterium]